MNGDREGSSLQAQVIGAAPEIPPWMLDSAEPVHQASLLLVVVSQSVRQLADVVASRLVDAGTALGWEGVAAEVTSSRASVDRSRMVAAADILERAGASLRRLTEALVSHGPALRALQQERATYRTTFGVGTDPLQLSAADSAAALDERIRAHVTALEAAERSTHASLRSVPGALDEVGRAAAEESWVVDLAPPSLAGALQRAGVLPDVAEQRLLEVMLLAPAGQAGAGLLRRELQNWPPGRIADLLLRHPELAERLTAPVQAIGDWAPDTETRQLFAAATRSDVSPQERIEGVRAFFASLDATDAARLALLYPAVVGGLDGAPIALRVEANRVNIAATLNAEQRNQLALNAALGQATLDGDTGEAADRRKALSQSQTRTAYYEKLLYEQVHNPSYLPGRSLMVGHQILFFDPNGDGRIAELWGDIDAKTEHVGIFVPGTGTTLDSFASVSTRAFRLTRADTTGQTAVVAWLGTDMPDWNASEPTTPTLAQEGAAPLRNFFDGLQVPQGVDTTVVGHSYGGATVGLAEAAGMHPTRILMVESAGTGYGVDHLTTQDLQSTGHYTMTAPGDLIDAAQKSGSFFGHFGLGHGRDPDTTPGFTRLETGRFDDGAGGEMIEGFKSHSLVFTPGSTSFNNMAAVIRGDRVTVYTPPERIVVHTDAGPVTRTIYPYENPSFNGPQEDIP